MIKVYVCVFLNSLTRPSEIQFGDCNKILAITKLTTKCNRDNRKTVIIRILIDSYEYVFTVADKIPIRFSGLLKPVAYQNQTFLLKILFISNLCNFILFGTYRIFCMFKCLFIVIVMIKTCYSFFISLCTHSSQHSLLTYSVIVKTILMFYNIIYKKKLKIAWTIFRYKNRG